MSDHDEGHNAPEPTPPPAPAMHGVMGEYDNVDTLMAACRRIRDAGYTKTDAYTPFPVHGIDTALGIKPTILPWIALIGGVTGTCTALAMQIWMNAIDYPYIISGKPYISLPAFMPVAFELTILFAAFGTFFGMWALNGLPRFSNPVFTDPRFDRATDDKFFLYVDAKDEKFDRGTIEAMFSETGSEYIAPVMDDGSKTQVPKFIFMIWIMVIGFSVFPLLIALKMRLTRSSLPRFHVFFDMDFSPAKDAQTNTTLFADARSMRPDVDGTVYRGQVAMDIMTGVDMESLAMSDPSRAARLVAMFDDDESPSNEQSSEQGNSPDSETGQDATPWLTEIPIPVTEEMVHRGQQQFNIYCAVCHGNNGDGNGLVNRRAQKILATNWIPPSSLHDSTLYEDAYPEGKLFSTISNGIRKMPGYGSQIKVEDRWAVVAYVRALQQSRQATEEVIPKDRRSEIMAKKSEIEKKLQEEAEKEKQAAEPKET